MTPSSTYKLRRAARMLNLLNVGRPYNRSQPMPVEKPRLIQRGAIIADDHCAKVTTNVSRSIGTALATRAPTSSGARRAVSTQMPAICDCESTEQGTIYIRPRHDRPNARYPHAQHGRRRQRSQLGGASRL